MFDLSDGRSYRPETFAAALKNLGTNAAAAAFAKFINDLKTTTAAEEPIVHFPDSSWIRFRFTGLVDLDRSRTEEDYLLLAPISYFV